MLRKKTAVVVATVLFVFTSAFTPIVTGTVIHADPSGSSDYCGSC